MLRPFSESEATVFCNALVLWLSMPTPVVKISSILNSLSLHVDLPPLQCKSDALPRISPVCEVCMTVPYTALYVGMGYPELEIRPPIWLNPFVSLVSEESLIGDANAIYRRYCLARPDYLVWIQPVLRASMLLCDCRGTCNCHASVLQQLIAQSPDPDYTEQVVPLPLVYRFVLIP